MAYSNISASLTDAQKTAFKTSVTSLKSSLNFLISLSNAERIKLRKIGTKRVGYVSGIYKAVVSNPAVMPTAFNITEFGKDVVLYSDLIELLDAIRPLCEAMEDTMYAVGSEAIREADEAYGYLKVAAKKSNSGQNLKDIVSSIAEPLKQKNPKKSKKTT